MEETDNRIAVEDPLKDLRKRAGRKKMLAAAVIFLLLAGLGGGYYFYKYDGREAGSQDSSMNMGMDIPGRRDLVTAGGTSSVGIVTEEFGIDYLDTDLTIEEVYLSYGDEVEAGTPILKIRDEDIRDAGRELERLAAKSGIAYRQGRIDYKTGENDAKAEYDTSLAELEYAQADYDAKLAEAQREVEELEEKAADAKELYEEYYNGIYKDGYYEEFEVAEKKAAYEEHKTLYDEYLKRWNIDDTEVNRTSGGSSSAGGENGLPAGGGMDSDRQERLNVLGLLEDEYREDREQYEQAEENYQKALEIAQAGLKAAQDAAELAALELEQARIDYEKKAASYLAEYETAQARASTAQTTYNTAVKRLQEELENLEYEKETAAGNLEEFMSTAGDGYLYTSERGTVVMTPFRKNTELTGNSMVLAYSNPDILTVTASVDQASIAKLTVGDEAVAVFTDYGNFGGVVTSINPVSDSNSRTSVTYSVEVTLEGDVSVLSANKSATVIFGISLDEWNEQSESMQEQKHQGAGVQGGGADEN